jgi:hypothetical protein
MSQPDTVYDTDYQLRALTDMASAKLTLADFAKPEIAQLMIERHLFTLTDLKSVKGEVTGLREAVQKLGEEREQLRISLAEAKQRQSFLWLEIPLGVFSGFAINMLTKDFSDGFGWVVLIISLIMLSFLRLRGLERKDVGYAK